MSIITSDMSDSMEILHGCVLLELARILITPSSEDTEYERERNIDSVRCLLGCSCAVMSSELKILFEKARAR